MACPEHDDQWSRDEKLPKRCQEFDGSVAVADSLFGPEH